MSDAPAGPVDAYWMPARPSEGLFKSKGSKHFGYIFPVRTEEEIAAHLEAVRKAHHAARHHCYAWRLGPTGEQWRAQDDGEPAHSAGTPILGALRSREVTYCLAVVVRYFGGIKLGVGGLIEAYREATLDALDHGELVERHVEAVWEVRFGYERMSDAMRILKEFDCVPEETDFRESCRMRTSIRLGESEALGAAFNGVYGIEAERLTVG
jgi:uncharacterized YigZ family protein